MSTEPFVIERTLNAPVEKVWKAITDKEQMKKWYFNIAEFEPEVGFEFQFEGGTEDHIFLHKCKITEVIPNRKLTYSWRYEGYDGMSYVTFDLNPEGDKTNLRLTHEGLESFPQHGDFDKANFAEGWNYIIGTAIKLFVEKESVNP